MKNAILYTIIFSVFIIGCKKDNSNDAPSPEYEIITGQPSNITNTSAIIDGEIINTNGETINSYGHTWSTNPNPTVDLNTKTIYESINNDTSFTSQLTNLKKNSKYYIRTYTIDETGTYYGNEENFTTTETFFKFIIGNKYLINDTFQSNRGWILIYSSDGTLIDYKEVANNSTIEFEWPSNNISNKYNIQIFSETKYDTTFTGRIDRYSLDCNLAMIPDTWYLGVVEENQNYDRIGTNIIEMNDINENDYWYIEAKNKYTNGFWDNNHITMHQHFNPDNIFILLLNENQAPYYKWFNDVGLNENYSITSSDLDQMSNYVDVFFPNGNSDYVYVESEDDLSTDIWDWYMVFYNSENDQSNIRTYYPDNIFNGYWSYLKAKKDNKTEYMIRRRGDIPTEFVSINVDINVTNSSINNFDASFIGDADYAYCNWNYEDYNYLKARFSYNVFGELSMLNSYTAPILPPDIYALNESILDISNLDYNFTTFYDYDAINNFGDYITKKYVLNEKVLTGVIEYYYKTIYFNTNKSNDCKEEIRKIRQERNN